MPEDDLTLISPEYKSLAIALDAELIKRLLDSKLQVYLGKNSRLKSLTVTRAFPQPDKSFLIQYQVEIENLEELPVSRFYLFGHLFASDKEKSVASQYAPANTLLLNELNMARPVFPYDPGLKNLIRLMDPQKYPTIFEPILQKYGKSAAICDASIEILGYRLSRRCVLGYHFGLNSPVDNADKEMIFIAKIYRSKRAKKAANLIEFLSDNGFSNEGGDMLRVTNLIQADFNNDILFIRPGSGKSLHSLFAERIFVDGCMAAASILNKLHSLVNESLPAYTYKDELEKLGEKIELFRRIFPGLSPRLDGYLRLLTANSRIFDQPLKYVCSHRDFYDKQVIYSKDMATLIDCDYMAMADPALDCGNFLGHLILRRLQYPQAAQVISAGQKAFRNTYDYSKYNTPKGGFEVRANWWKAATLLRILMLYSIRPKWQSLIPAILAEMDKIWKR